MKRLTVQLLGYFDCNFGDDYMMKLIVDSLPEIDFVIDKNEKVSPLLCGKKNVFIAENPEKCQYPKLTVVGSGFMLNSNAAVKSELIKLIKGDKTAKYCLGCNIEPLDSTFKKWLIRRKLNRFRLIVCRDKKSFYYLKKNTDKPRVEYLPDILFSLPDEILPNTSKGKKLGVSLMHRSGDTETCHYYKVMAEAVDYWIEKTGENALLMAFDSGEENDVYCCECVKKLTAHPEKVEIAVHKNGNEIFEAYSDCNRIISTRFHSAVLALRAGLPFYPVVYRDKMKNLLEDMAYPISGSGIDEVDICDVKNFLIGETHYKLSENVIPDSTLYAKVFKETLNKDSELQ